jgi:hypothetical protein
MTPPQIALAMIASGLAGILAAALVMWGAFALVDWIRLTIACRRIRREYDRRREREP